MKWAYTIFLWIGILMWLWGFLQYSQAQSDLELLSKQLSVSRFEMVRLIEEANCNNCLTPPWSWRSKYNQSWLSQFQWWIANNFDDLIRENALFDEKNYYYCVSHAGDQWWVNGYPRFTPGLCQGKFCGENNARGTELIQMVTNMIADKVRHLYPVSFQDIKSRSLSSGVLNDIPSLAVINKWIQRCGEEPCIAENLDEFSVFMKYCSNHLESCNMKAIAPFVQGQWPIAELNVLYKSNILDINDPMIARLWSIIQGSDIVRLLPAIQQTTSCSVIHDYDGDAIANTIDNCPYHYNPHQRDFDRDNKGDVCDEDIDADGLENLVGLVNDDGVIVKQQETWMDDCPLVPTSQLGQYDCPSFLNSQLIAFDIQASPEILNHQGEVDFFATIVWWSQQLEWDFGDGTKLLWWPQVRHAYQQDGLYNVLAYSNSFFWQKLVSQLQVLIWNVLQTGTTALTCAYLTGDTQTDMNCTLRNISLDPNQITMLRWSWWDGEESLYTSSLNDQFTQNHVYKKPGNYTIEVDIYLGLETFIKQKLVVYIFWADPCFADTNRCDLDKDLAADVCDDDIDGDGVKNIIGIVQYDLSDCSFSEENIDRNIFTDQLQAIKKWASYDNCSFVSNVNQEDDDIDAVWNLCDSEGSGEDIQTQFDEDTDQDKILDDRDACPTIPENYNGVQDLDWCPELPSSCKPWSKCSGQAPVCNSCPCPGADYGSQLWKGDSIRAVLLDENASIIYRYSPSNKIDVHIPDKMIGN